MPGRIRYKGSRRILKFLWSLSFRLLFWEGDFFSKPEVIQKTFADIKATNPDYIVPTHCTDHKATALFEKAMPHRHTLITAGTKYVITS